LRFLWDFIKGTIIGIGAVAPGVSGGTFAVMLGVYDKLTGAIASFFNDIRSIKSIKNRIIELFPLGFGIGAGFLAFGNIMKYLFEFHESQVKLFFIGLMLGSLPSVFKDANKKGFKKHYILPSIITFGITIAFMILENSVIKI
jgi:putative membrane protein